MVIDLPLLLRGLLIGFSIAAPVGPIGVLCIRRTLAEGRLAGLVSGLGAATADAVYGFIAAFGLTFISAFLVEQQEILSLVGGLFLVYLGIRTFLTVPAEQAASSGGNTLLGMYASTFFLTLTNPITILSFAAIFAGLGLSNSPGSYASAALLVLGVFLGSAAWWLLLSGAVSLLRSRFTRAAMQWVNRISGIIIFGFGIAMLVGLVLFRRG